MTLESKFYVVPVPLVNVAETVHRIAPLRMVIEALLDYNGLITYHVGLYLTLNTNAYA